MSYLYQALARRVDAWRASHYACDAYPTIREILAFATEDAATGQLRYLRRAQLRALETYWYLRLVLGTPTTPELYEALFPKLPERLGAMGVNASHRLGTMTSPDPSTQTTPWWPKTPTTIPCTI